MSKVVVTGMGLSTSLGAGAAATWDAIARGPGAVIGANPGNGFERAKALAQFAAEEAMAQAGLRKEGFDPERMGCTFSASKPLFDGDDVRAPDELNRFIGTRFGIEGDARNIVAACATGAYSIAIGASWIEQGFCDVVLAGSVEPYPHPLIEAGFRRMGVTSDDGMTRPFDLKRSGFSFGEGAGAIVLESDDSARRRGARALVRLSGWAMGADSHSAVAFNSGGARIAAVIRKALDHAGLSTDAVRHVNAHGTATRHNDWIETQALMQAFGPHAKDLMISATKAATGHLLGASGSVEFVLTALALTKQFIPPTATLQESDPACSLDYTPGKGHEASFDHALSLSFGFGGPIAALAVSRS